MQLDSLEVRADVLCRRAKAIYQSIERGVAVTVVHYDQSVPVGCCLCQMYTAPRPRNEL